jgi:hypothetical protein
MTQRHFIAAALFGTACAAAVGLAPLDARETNTVASNYVFDGSWPKLPLPNPWTFGGVTGLAVDNDDLVRSWDPQQGHMLMVDSEG